VRPGFSALVQASATTPPGDDAAWFWSDDCSVDCDHLVAAADLGITWGAVPERGAAYALTAGLSGVYPYVDGYVQLGRGSRMPFGLGARVGVPVDSWNEYAVYGRVDRRLGARRRLLLNSAVFVHTGHSPNGANPGSFVAFVQGVGVLFEGTAASCAPGLAVIAGGGRRNGSSFTSVFLMASATVTLHRGRGPLPARSPRRQGNW
jgi:hypothetical protein